MPITYKIDKDKRLVETTGTGVFLKEEAAAHLQQLLNDPDFEPNYSLIIDFTRMERFEVSEADVRFLSEWTIFAPTARRALIAGSDEAFGLGRMYEIIREMKGESGIRVVRTREEALEWLFLQS